MGANHCETCGSRYHGERCGVCFAAADAIGELGEELIRRADVVVDAFLPVLNVMTPLVDALMPAAMAVAESQMKRERDLLYDALSLHMRSTGIGPEATEKVDELRAVIAASEPAVRGECARLERVVREQQDRAEAAEKQLHELGVELLKAEPDAEGAPLGEIVRSLVQQLANARASAELIGQHRDRCHAEYLEEKQRADRAELRAGPAPAEPVAEVAKREIDTFDLSERREMVKANAYPGDWVRFEDHAALVDELAAAAKATAEQLDTLTAAGRAIATEAWPTRAQFEAFHAALGLGRIAEVDNAPDRWVRVSGPTGDWVGFYRNGQLMAEGHSVDGVALLESLGFKVERAEFPAEWEETGESLPDDLSDIPGAAGEVTG